MIIIMITFFPFCLLFLFVLYFLFLFFLFFLFFLYFLLTFNLCFAFTPLFPPIQQSSWVKRHKPARERPNIRMQQSGRGRRLSQAGTPGRLTVQSLDLAAPCS